MGLPNKPINPWWTVVAGALGTGAGAGIIVIYAFGILATGFAEEFGWSRSVYSYAQTSFLIATGFGTLWLGVLISRYGIRIPAIAMIVAFAIAIAMVGVLPASPLLFYVVFAIIGITGSAATAMPYAIAVTGWFDRRRGLALGLVNVGAGLGSALTPYFAGWLNDTQGWRLGFMAIGAIYGGIALFGLIALVRDPIKGAQSASPRRAPPAAHDSAPRSYLRDRSFWLIATAITGISIAVFGVLGSMVPLVSDRGFQPSFAATVLSTAGISSWISRLVTGYAMDRIFAPYVAMATFASALGGILLLVLGSGPMSMLSGAALVGVAIGAEGDLITYLVSRYFDLRVYSKVLGLLWITWAWGNGLGAYLAGLSFATTGSYTVSFWAFGACIALATIAVSRLGPYRQTLSHDSTPSESTEDRASASERA